MEITLCHDGSDLAESILNFVKTKVDKVNVIKCSPKIVFKENLIYFGYPLRFEIKTFEEILKMLKEGVSLSYSIAKKVARANSEIIVIVTPTCPYCVFASITASKFAIFNKNITTKIVDATFYPDIAEKYNVYAVPKIIIKKKNGEVREFEGAIPEEEFAELL